MNQRLAKPKKDAWNQFEKEVCWRIELHEDRTTYNTSENDQIEAALPAGQRLPDNREDHAPWGTPAVVEGKVHGQQGNSSSDF